MISQPPAPRPSALPDPEPHALAVSERLCDLIDTRIEAAGGALAFADYMHLALYAPQLGYYSAGSRKFGREGDFVTAPELGDGLARCLARQIVQIFELTGSCHILECGAGTGLLAAQILTALQQLNVVPDTYQILEVSPDLVQRQRSTVDELAPALADRVTWLASIPDAIDGVVIANELLDAMPVARFKVSASSILSETTVQSTQASHRFASGFASAANEAWHARIEQMKLPEGYQSEVNEQAQAWVRTVAQRLNSGAMILIDYGFPRHEFYHPQRDGGTLMCHYRHHADPDPYLRVGLQDITAHVDFTAMASEAHEAGLSICGYTQQAPFLMSLGLMESAEQAMLRADANALRLGTQIKLLTLPSEMGELFKVLIAGRGINAPLTGFSLKDDVHRL